MTSRGEQCRRRCCAPWSCCVVHLRQRYHLRVAPSEIHGKGVFATTASKYDEEEVIFEAGDEICRYDGEPVTEEELDARYGDDTTTPYGLRIGDSENFEDGALQRGTGSIINGTTRKKDANCEYVPVDDDTAVRVVATRDIVDGEELLVYYGKKFRFDEPGVRFTTNHRKHYY